MIVGYLGFYKNYNGGQTNMRFLSAMLPQKSYLNTRKKTVNS